MIRVRFPAGIQAPPWMRSLPSVELTDDSAVIALESEKNTSASRAFVNDVLQPEYAERWRSGLQLFRMISLETRAGCNATCSFCPVSRNEDPRPPGLLPMPVIEKIASELASAGFRGRVALFGNNEPLLDDRLARIVEVLRASLPHAEICLLTNGTLLTVVMVHDLFAAGLSRLTINNYTDGLRITRPVREVLCAAGQLVAYDVRVSIRSRTEILTTRGGQAPNRKGLASPPQGFCALPFTEIHVTYSGDVGLCCFDGVGVVKLGNVVSSTLAEIWSSEGLRRYRQHLLLGDRASLDVCRDCDFDGFRVLPVRDASGVRPQP